MSYNHGTHDGLKMLVEHIETDTTLAAFTLQRFGFKFQRAGGSMSKSSVERVTNLYALPDDWDKAMFNKPVHLYIVIPEQGDIEDYGECYSDVNTTSTLVLRFDSPSAVVPKNIYDTVDQVRNCIRRLDVISEPFFRNGETRFEIVENGFPAVTMSVEIQHRHGGE